MRSKPDTDQVGCLAVGLALVDYCYYLPDLPDGAGKYFAERVELCLGGVATNAALAMRALGAEVKLYSRLGQDASGDWIYAQLQAAGLNIDASVERVAGCASPSSAVSISADGERCIVNHRDPQLFAAAPRLPAQLLSGIKAVLCDTRWPRAAAAVMEQAQGLGVATVLDFDLNPDPSSQSLLALADYAVLAQPALVELSGCSQPEAGLRWLAQRYPVKRVAVTCGASGVYAVGTDASLERIAAYRVRAVNTLGAGDVFHGAFCYQLARGSAFIPALHYANAAAALHVSGTTFPRASAVEQLLQPD